MCIRDRVGDEGVEAARVAGYVLDPVSAALVVVEVGQQVGPYRGPRARRALGGHGRRCLLAGHALLGRDLEAGEEVGVLRLVVRLPIGLCVVLYAGVVGGHVLVSSRWFSGCRMWRPAGRVRPSSNAWPSRRAGRRRWRRPDRRRRTARSADGTDPPWPSWPAPRTSAGRTRRGR